MVLTDTHCHLDLDQFDQDRPQVIARAQQAGITRVLIPALDLASSRDILTLLDAHPILFAAAGVHPNSARTWNAQSSTQLRKLADHPRVVAIGEIGLDYYRDHAQPELQRKIFIEQLEIARECELPVVIHVRNKDKTDRACIIDLIRILEDWQKEVSARNPAMKNRLGVVHSFSGNLQEAHMIASLGFYIGITGPVTYKNAQDMQQAAAVMDLDRLLIETDAPFLTPHPMRGQRNEPGFVRFIANEIARLRLLPSQDVAQVTTENASTLFQWSRSG